MRSSIITASTMAALAVAAPVWPELNVNAVQPDGVNVVSDYFNMLAQKVEESKWMSMAPVCELSRAQLPQCTCFSSLHLTNKKAAKS
jgi:hypothetical protein